jgi:hypothetical protein
MDWRLPLRIAVPLTAPLLLWTATAVLLLRLGVNSTRASTSEAIYRNAGCLPGDGWEDRIERHTARRPPKTSNRAPPRTYQVGIQLVDPELPLKLVPQYD